MLSSISSSDDDSRHVEELRSFVAQLSQKPELEPIISEIEVLQSIYGEAAIRVFKPSSSNAEPEVGTTRYEANLSFPPPYEDITIRVLVSLPNAYPSGSPPQLQLLSRYIGPFGVGSDLLASIVRTYTSLSGVEFVEDQVCVFDGLQNVLEKCIAWYEEQLSLEKAGQLIREEQKEALGSAGTEHTSQREIEQQGGTGHLEEQAEMPPGIVIHVGEAIQDRKSAFVGRACKITHPSQVPQVLACLMSDKKIAKAAHPIINAWRCQVDNILHQDNDDDGETAAGGRLAHLLQLLEVNNVLVIVTRYFGGIHLGPDRFKHINQAARNALEAGGFLDTPETNGKKPGARAKKH